MNQITLEGNVGNDPEVKHLDNGKAVANISLATNETWKNKQGEKVTETEWHRLVVWSPLAEVFEKHVKKGSKVLVQGKVKTRSYDASDGSKRYTTEVLVNWFKFTGSAPVVPHDITPESEKAAIEAADNESDVNDDLPF